MLKHSLGSPERSPPTVAGPRHGTGLDGSKQSMAMIAAVPGCVPTRVSLDSPCSPFLVLGRRIGKEAIKRQWQRDSSTLSVSNDATEASRETHPSSLGPIAMPWRPTRSPKPMP